MKTLEILLAFAIVAQIFAQWTISDLRHQRDQAMMLSDSLRREKQELDNAYGNLRMKCDKNYFATPEKGKP